MTNEITTSALPVLAEGASYRLELMMKGKIVRGTLLRIVDDAPLGRGFSFQLTSRRLFVYERDLRPGPKGILLCAV